MRAGAYLGDFNLLGEVGRSEGRHRDVNGASAEIMYYPFDNFFVATSYTALDIEGNDGRPDAFIGSAMVRGEWMVVSDQPTGLSFIASASRNFNDNKGAGFVFAGFRVLMGVEPKPLIRRMREDTF